jgi:hypothetical protein
MCVWKYIQRRLQVSARGSFQHSQQVAMSRMGAKAIWAKIQFIYYISLANQIGKRALRL